MRYFKPQMPARRNPAAVAAYLRGGAGPMKHRFAPRGGAQNPGPEWLDEVAEADVWGMALVDEEAPEPEPALLSSSPITGRADGS